MASVSFPACGGYGIIRITDSDWYGWNIRGSSDYVNFYTTSGIGTSNVFYEIKPNCSTSSKSASFSLYTDDGYSMGVWSVSIAAKKTGDDQVTVTPTSLAMPLGAPETVSVETEGTWTLCTPIMDDAYAIYRNQCEIKVTGALIGTEYTGSRDFTVTYQDGNKMYVSRLNVRLACTDQDITVRQADYPTIANKTIRVPAEGATIQIGPYNTTSWLASGFPDWIIPSTTGGTAIARFTITVPPNITGGSRTGTFIIKTGGTSYTFTVIQDNLDVSGPGTITFDNAGGSASGTITYELEPDTITHKAEGDWITLTNGTNAADFNVSVPAVGGIVSRSGNVISTLTYGDQSATIITSVVQEGSNYRFTPATAEIPAEGGSVTIEVESDYPLDGYNSVSSSFGTISFTRVSDKKISIEYTRPFATSDINDTVVLNGDAGFSNISLTSITQPNGAISPEDTTLEVPVGGGTYEFGYYPDGTYTVSSMPSGIKSVSISGNTMVKITVEVNPNISSSVKSGDIVIQGPNNQFKIAVTQEALSVKWGQQPYIFANNSGGTYTNLVEYNLKPDSIVYSIPFADWVRVTGFDLGATYSNNIIEIEAAGGDVARSAAISAELHYGDQTYLVTNDILQYSKNYTVSPSGTIVVPPEGGQAVITIESDYTLSNYTSVIASYGTVVFERLSDTKIQVTIDFKPNYGDPISMVPTLKTNSSGLYDIVLNTITQDTFDFTWEINKGFIWASNSTPEYPDIDEVSSIVDYNSTIAIPDMTFSIEYLGDETDWLIEVRENRAWESGEGSIYLNAKDNRLGKYRTARITVSSEKLNTARTFEVEQEGVVLYFDPSTATIDYKGGSVTTQLLDMYGWVGPDDIDVTLNGEVAEYTHQFNSRALEMTFQIPENEGAERVFDYYVTLKNYNDSASFEITQTAFDLAWDFPTDPIYFDDNGGTVRIEFTSAEDIENIIISNVPAWLTFTRSGNTITCKAAQNTSSQPRTATVSFEAEGYNITKQIVFTQEKAELSITREAYLYVYPADINGYVAKNVPVHITCNIWNPGYSWEISTFKEGYETDCKAVVDHYETSDNVASVYLNLFSLILLWHNAIINVKIKNGDEIVYEEDVDVKWQYVRSYGKVWHQDFGVSTGVVVNTMARKKQDIYIGRAAYGRIRGKFYAYDYESISGSGVKGDLSYYGSQSLFEAVVVQAKDDNTTGVVRDCKGTYTMTSPYNNSSNTVPITVRQVGNEKYTCIAEERIPYNKTCVSFAYGGYMPYTFNIKADNYVKYIQFEDTQNWECYTAVLYGLEPNLTDQDREIRIPYDVMNGTTLVESGEMVIIQETALKVSQTEILAPQQGGEYYIDVSVFGDWTVETSGAFFEVEPTSGNGDGGFLIKVYENPYVDMREGVVYVKTADETIEIKISQEGFAPWLYFGKEYIPVRRAGGLVRLMLYSNIRWTTEWVTL